MSNVKTNRAFIVALKREKERTGQDVFTMTDLRRVADNVGVRVDNFQDFIDTLNYQNFLLKRGTRSYSLALE
jgi:hypothetical protein